MARKALYVAKKHPRDRVRHEVHLEPSGSYSVIRHGGQGRVIKGFAPTLELASKMAEQMAGEEK